MKSPEMKIRPSFIHKALATIFLATLSSVAFSQITINPGGTPTTIINNLVGQGITVSNVVINCGATSYGTFSGNLGAGGTGLSNGGIVLTTGSAAGADGPNSSGSTSTAVAGFDYSDPQLTTQPGAGNPPPNFDNCVLEFDMIPTCNQFNVSFVFGSEEYPEFVSSSFNDGFGMFIWGPNPLGGNYTAYNFARLPNGQLVSIDNVSPSANAAYYNTNTTGIMQYDGYTDGLTASISVTPCQSYHIKIIIADAGDGVWDSGLFLGYQSFSCTTVPLTLATSSTPSVCGANNGTATVTTSGGVGPFTYLWSPGGQTTASISNLAPGSYTVTVNDPLSCTPPQTSTVVVGTSGTGPTLNPAVTNATCGCNGSINVNASGGTTPYTYTWTGGLSGASPSSVCPGTYSVTVASANGCSTTQNITVTGPPTLTATANATPVTCNGGCNGTATVSPSGGTAPYSYSWSPGGANTQTASNLCAGTYTVTVTAQGGCTTTATATVTQPTALSATAATTPVSCNGGSNGTITVTPSGGTAPYTYSLNGSAFGTSNSFTGLTASTHTIVVKDANGCTFNLSPVVSQPAALTGVVASNVSSTCGLTNGSFTLTAAGGTAPYSYSNGGAFQPSATFSNLAAGTYNATIQDANGCQFTLPVQIVISVIGTPTASVTSVTNVTCFGGANGSATIGVVGGTGPFMYDINPPSGPNPPAQASNVFTNLTAGTYPVVVTGGGCTTNTTITITQPTQLSFTSVKTNASCNGVCDGTITVTASNATPSYEYSSNGGLSFQTSNVLTGLCAGTISVVVRDANGCTVNQNIIITQPGAVTATYTGTNPLCEDAANGSIAVASQSGGTAPFQYSLNAGALQSGTTFSGLGNGVYTMMIQDANGCQSFANVTLTDPPGYTVDTVYTTPSNCGFNNGAFEVIASGGNPPYNYDNVTIASGPQATGSFLSLVAGAYEILVTDALGCQETYFVGVNDVEMDGVLNSVTNATCPGACDGAVNTNATGGFGTITYDVDNGAMVQFGSGVFAGLCEGSHAVIMTDQGLCVFVVTFNVTDPDDIIFTTSTTNVSCNGGTDGTITFAAPTGGTAPFEYSADNGVTFQSGSTITGLAAGLYNVVVRDANGCTQAGIANITEPNALTISESHSDLLCINDNTGTITIAGAGGTGTITYSFDNCTTFGASPFQFGLAAGTYNLCVKDANNCTATTSVTLTEPTAISATLTPDDPNCLGATDGSISVNASGGTAPYEYSADNGTTFQPTTLFSNLGAGNYTVIIRDDNNCTLSVAQALVAPAGVTFTNANTPSTCSAANGVVTITANGGTPGYQYSINGGTLGASNVFNGLTATTHFILVQDANGCQALDTAIIIDYPAPIILGVLGTDPLCNGASDGTADVLISGGTAPIQISMDGGANQTTTTFNGLAAGNHNVSITDANGCTDTYSFTLNNPTAVSFTSSTTPLNCNNDFTGAVSVSASGGNGVYEYSFDNGTSFGASNSLNFIAAGNYNIVVRDGNGCTANGSATVTQPAPLVFNNFTVVNASCFGVCDGQVQAFPGGGTVNGLYHFIWSNSIAGPSQATATNICAGNYSVEVNDDNGCSIDTTFTITEPAQVIINNTVVTDVLCNAACDGTITVNSALAVNFSIDNGATFQASNAFTNICAGVYDIIAQDASGCEADTTITVLEPPVMSIIAPNAGISCSGGDFQLIALGQGGTPPYTYTWSNGATTTSSQYVGPTALTTYTVFATDANGCVSPTVSADVDVYPIYTATVSADTTICPGSSITLMGEGSLGLAPYYYAWSSGDSTQATTVSPTSATTYTLMTFDVCGDTLYLDVNVDLHTLPAVNFAATPATGCTPLTTTLDNLTPAAQVGGNCTWDFGPLGTVNNCGSVTQTFVTPGCYDITLTVTSPEGCVGDTTIVNAVCVYDLPVADFSFSPLKPTILEPTVSFNNESTGASTYIWTFDTLGTSTQSDPTYTFPGGMPDTYQVCLTAVSQYGCMDSTCQDVIIYDELLLYVPNAFSPDNDGINDIFLPVINGVDPTKYELMIFDRWGELIFSTQNPQQGWDGTHKAVDSKQDVYVWKIKAVDQIKGDTRVYYGHVSLLR